MNDGGYHYSPGGWQGRRVSLAHILFLFLSSCQHTGASHEAAEPGPSETLSTVHGTDVSGWEGFYPWSGVDDSLLEWRGIPLSAEIVRGTFERVGKLVIATGEQQASPQELDRRYDNYCSEEARIWNEELCASLVGRTCEGDLCTYEHFGNCSGLFIGNGLFLTAAHCVAGLFHDESLRSRSVILRAGDAFRPEARLELGQIELGKQDFAHHWVVIDEETDPVDVATVAVDDGGLLPVEWAQLPPEGSVVFLAGFPRVERRSDQARREHRYELSFGVPTTSFGRVADRNNADLPLCNVDGNQEHWALAATCHAGEVQLGETQTWQGVITNTPFLATYDTSNGYSGGPVFDDQGRFVGVNVTMISSHDPQERFSPDMRVVAIPARRAMSRLGVPQTRRPAELLEE